MTAIATMTDLHFRTPYTPYPAQLTPRLLDLHNRHDFHLSYSYSCHSCSSTNFCSSCDVLMTASTPSRPVSGELHSPFHLPGPTPSPSLFRRQLATPAAPQNVKRARIGAEGSGGEGGEEDEIMVPQTPSPEQGNVDRSSQETEEVSDNRPVSRSSVTSHPRNASNAIPALVLPFRAHLRVRTNSIGSGHRSRSSSPASRQGTYTPPLSAVDSAASGIAFEAPSNARPSPTFAASNLSVQDPSVQTFLTTEDNTFDTPPGAPLLGSVPVLQSPIEFDSDVDSEAMFWIEYAREVWATQSPPVQPFVRDDEPVDMDTYQVQTQPAQPINRREGQHTPLIGLGIGR